MSANVTVRKGLREGVKYSFVWHQDQFLAGHERSKTLSKSMAAGMAARPASSANTKLIEKSRALSSADTLR